MHISPTFWCPVPAPNSTAAALHATAPKGRVIVASPPSFSIAERQYLQEMAAPSDGRREGPDRRRGFESDSVTSLPTPLPCPKERYSRHRCENGDCHFGLSNAIPSIGNFAESSNVRLSDILKTSKRDTGFIITPQIYTNSLGLLRLILLTLTSAVCGDL